MKRKALFVGINRYEKLRPLKYCSGDAQSLYDLFTEVGGYDELLLRSDLDLSGLRKAIDSLVSNMRAGDFLFFYFSGHGYTDSGKHLLLCADDMLSNLRYGMFGIPFDYLRGLVTDKHVNAVFVLDTCRSDLLTGDDKCGKGGTNNGTVESFLTGMQGESSMAVMRACGQYQFAYESDEICHSRFTYAFLKTLKSLTRNGLPVSPVNKISSGVRTAVSTVASRSESTVPSL